ncbi:MAG: cobalamin-binding protein [Conexivisphaerales archaeon]
MRILSTIPSATEIVCALGLEKELVGVSDECDYPSSVSSKPVVVRSRFDTSAMSSSQIDSLVSEYYRSGISLYTVDRDILGRLKPDLVVTQDVCDVCATSSAVVLEALEKSNLQAKVIALNPHTLEDVFQDIIKVGKAANRLRSAEQFVNSLKRRVERIKSLPRHDARVVCLEWIDPPYCSGHWLPQLVEYAGGKEVLGLTGKPSRRITWQEIANADPEYLLLTVCGYDVQRTLKELYIASNIGEWREIQAVRESNVYVMNGSWYYSRPGPRLVEGLEALAAIFNHESDKLSADVGIKLTKELLTR